MPEEFYLQSIYPEARSVIVIGLPVIFPVLETAPSILYHELYTMVNILLDQYIYRLAMFLTQQGHPSMFIPGTATGWLPSCGATRWPSSPTGKPLSSQGSAHSG
jgi:epoxyqueuosine reductase